MKPSQLFSLENQVAIVTGASAGLGEAMAKGLAGAGAKLVLAARRLERLENLARELAAGGTEALAIECDVTRVEDVDRMVGACQDRFGRLDVLVNNAGIANVSPAEDENPDDFKWVLDVNVVGVFICAQRCGRVMLGAGRGSIINIASMFGIVGAGTLPEASYTASKGAVTNLTRELAAQWSKRGVRVNALGPGYFPSEMTTGMFDNERSLNYIKKRTLLKRGGRPEELIGPLLLLASEDGSYITGQIIVVDGGWTSV